MLITNENILQRFRDHVSWATNIDLASAWATSNEGLRALAGRATAIEVRAVVGLWGHLTDPFALRTLADTGDLRGVDAHRRFHPKVFIFRGAGRSVAWVGSANFTSGGFGRNEEALFETEATETVQDWFDALWSQCEPLTAAAIDKYALSRRANNPSPPPPPRPPYSQVESPMQLLQRARDWRSYVTALNRCDVWWSNRRPWSVLGDRASWRETVEVAHDIARHGDWGELGEFDRRRLLGVEPGEGWALLGRMRPPAMKTVFGANRETIQRIVHMVAAANDGEFPRLAFEAYEDLRAVDGVGEGIASRLLTLARPDRFVSVNGASKKCLAKLFELPPTTLGKPRNYRRLLELVYGQAWYQEPAPTAAHEQALYRMRTALLDCFVYDDEAPG